LEVAKEPGGTETEEGGGLKVPPRCPLSLYLEPEADALDGEGYSEDQQSARAD